MKIQINRKHYIELDNISKIVEKNGKLYVYKVSGYPKIIKADLKLPQFLMRIANAGKDFQKILIIKE